MKIVNPTPSLAGFRNKIVNGNFAINQRGYVSGGALTATQYAHDRWRDGNGGNGSPSGYTFVQAVPTNYASNNGIDTLVTVPSGSALQQIVDAAVAESGLATLSWVGTGVASLIQWNNAANSWVSKIPAGAKSPYTFQMDAGLIMAIGFANGTVGNVQLEMGSVATPFERRPPAVELVMCQRFYTLLTSVTLQSPAAGQFAVSIRNPVTMRAVPTVATVVAPTYSNASSAQAFSNSADITQLYISASATGGNATGWTVSLSAEL